MRAKRLAKRVVRINKAENQLDRAAQPTPEADSGCTPAATNDTYLPNRGLPEEAGPTSGGTTFYEIDRMLSELLMCPRCRI